MKPFLFVFEFFFVPSLSRPWLLLFNPAVLTAGCMLMQEDKTPHTTTNTTTTVPCQCSVLESLREFIGGAVGLDEALLPRSTLEAARQEPITGTPA